MREDFTTNHSVVDTADAVAGISPFHPAPLVISLLQAAKTEVVAGCREEARSIYAAAVAVDVSPLSHYLFAEMLNESHDLTHALHHLHGGWESAKRMNSPTWRARCCHAIADIHQQRYEGHMADRFRQLALTAEMDEVELSGNELPAPTGWLCDRARSAADWNDLPAAEHLLQYALRTIDCNQSTTVAEIMLNLGVINLRKGLWARGLRFFQSAFQEFTNDGDVAGTAQTVENIGHLLSSRCQYSKAATCFRRAIRLFETLGASGSIVRCRQYLNEVRRFDHVRYSDPLLN